MEETEKRIGNAGETDNGGKTVTEHGIALESCRGRVVGSPEEDPRKEPQARAGSAVIVCVALSILCGGLSGLAAAWRYHESIFAGQNDREIVMADVGDIIQAKKKAIVEKYKAKEDTEAARAEMQKEINEFFNHLNAVLAANGGDRIVLSKDAVLSGGKDITEEVSKEVNGR